MVAISDFCSSAWLLVQVVRLAYEVSQAVFQTQYSSDRLHNTVFRSKDYSKKLTADYSKRKKGGKKECSTDTCWLHSTSNTLLGLCTLYSSTAGWCKKRNKRTDSAVRHVDVEKLEVYPSFASASWAFGWCDEKQELQKRKRTKKVQCRLTVLWRQASDEPKCHCWSNQGLWMWHVTRQSRVHEHVP